MTDAERMHRKFTVERTKMRKDLVLLIAMRHLQDGPGPINVKSLLFVLSSVGWPYSSFMWAKVISEMASDGVLVQTIGRNKQPFEVYFREPMAKNSDAFDGDELET